MKINKKNVTPAIIAVAVYLLAYQIPKIVVDPSRLHFLCTALDDKIPFVSYFIYIYIGGFFQWAYCAYIVCKQDEMTANKVFSAIAIGSFIGFLTFMIYPTAVNRPEIVGQGFTNDFCRFIYSVDNIICACPSFHCFCSTIVVLIYKKYECVSKKTINFNIVYSLLVFISTLLTKQHYIVDILPGILLAFISIYIGDKFPITKYIKSI